MRGTAVRSGISIAVGATIRRMFIGTVPIVLCALGCPLMPIGVPIFRLWADSQSFISAQVLSARHFCAAWRLEIVSGM